MDVESVPEESERRAAKLRPLVALGEAPAVLVRAAACDLNISERWAYHLIRRLREHGGELSALLPHDGRGAPCKPRISGDREAIISVVISSEYLTHQKARPAQIVRAVRAQCREKGISAPSEATIRRRLRQIPKDDISRSREVEADTKPVFGATPIPDYPLDVVQIDHMPVDVILLDAAERLPIGRPYLTIGIDVTSRTIAGFLVSLDAPSSTSVGLCLTHIATEKEAWMAARGVADVTWPIAGRPKKLDVDNAAEFHSQAFERGGAQHGIEIDWRPPDQPHFGGIVERLIGTLMRRIHTLAGTTFSNTMQRGNYDSDGRACLTLEELERWLTVAICKDYHQSVHRGLDGAAPIARLEEGLAALGHAGGCVAASQDPRRYLIDFLPVFRRTLQRDGFTVDHIRYFSNALKPWIASRDAGVEGPMLLRRDPRDLSRIYVLDPFDGSYLEVPCRTLSGPAITLWEHRAATRRTRETQSAQLNEDMIFMAFQELQDIERSAIRSTRAMRRKKSRPSIDRASDPVGNSDVGNTCEPDTDAVPPRPFPDIDEW